MNIYKWDSTTTLLPMSTEFNLELMMNEVAEAFGVNRRQLFSRARNQQAKFARWVVWKIMRAQGYTVTAVAEMFDYDHSTITHAMGCIEQDIKKVPLVQISYNRVKHYLKQKDHDEAI